MLHILIITMAYIYLLLRSIFVMNKIKDADFNLNLEEILMSITIGLSLTTISQFIFTTIKLNTLAIGSLWLAAILGLALCEYILKQHQKGISNV